MNEVQGIQVRIFSIISTEKERDDEADSDSNMYDSIGFSISPDRLL